MRGDVLVSAILTSIVQIIDSYDSFDVYRNLTSEQKLERSFFLTKEEKEHIESCGHIDEKYRAQVSLFFQAVALTIEKQTGNMVSSVVELNDEGFGQAILFSGRLVLFSMGLRGAQQFAFTAANRVDKKGEKIVEEAVGLIKKFPEIINLN